MKNCIFIALAACLVGCHRSEFDVSADQVTKHVATRGGPTGGMPDLNHLPPGAVKHEIHFKKGDVMPDGQIATGNEKMVRVEMKGPGGAGNRAIVTDDVRIGPGGK